MDESMSNASALLVRRAEDLVGEEPWISTARTGNGRIGFIGTVELENFIWSFES